MQSPLPFAALLFNAFVWGLAWWPFQHMHQAGLHPLWATAFMYAVVLLALLAWRPTLWAQVRQHPELWLLALASGLNNVAFNWAVTIGDVVRVILLFYLMPAWAVLLAWRILGEREFWGLPFRLSPATLEPRPDSETLIATGIPYKGHGDSERRSSNNPIAPKTNAGNKTVSAKSLS